MRIRTREDEKLDAEVKLAKHTRLSYTLETTPNPLQIDEEAKLTLIISPDEKESVIRRIDLQIPIGERPSHLTTEGRISARIVTSSKEGTKWGLDLSSTSGLIRITPPTIPFEFDTRQKSLQIEIYGFKVNDQIGHSKLVLIEYIIDSNVTQTFRRTISIPKFNPGFSLSNFQAKPASIIRGKSVSFSWEVIPKDCKLELSWYAQDGKRKKKDVTSKTSYPDRSDDPISLENTREFTLTATVPGPLVDKTFSTYVTVEVISPKVHLWVDRGKIYLEESAKLPKPAKLKWNFDYAAYCNIRTKAGVVIGAKLPLDVKEIEISPTETTTYHIDACDDSDVVVASAEAVAAVYHPAFTLVKFLTMAGVNDERLSLNFNSDGSKLFIAGKMIDTKTGAEDSSLPLGDFRSYAMHPREKKLYLLKEERIERSGGGGRSGIDPYDYFEINRSILIMDLTTGKTSDDFPPWLTETNQSRSCYPEGRMAIHPDGSRLYVYYKYFGREGDRREARYLNIYDITDKPKILLTKQIDFSPKQIAVSNSIFCMIVENLKISLTEIKVIVFDIISESNFATPITNAIMKQDIFNDKISAIHPNGTTLYIVVEKEGQSVYSMDVFKFDVPASLLLSKEKLNGFHITNLAVSPDKTKLYLSGKDLSNNKDGIRIYYLVDTLIPERTFYSTSEPALESKSVTPASHEFKHSLLSLIDKKTAAEKLSTVQTAVAPTGLSGLGFRPALFVLPSSGVVSSLVSDSLPAPVVESSPI